MSSEEYDKFARSRLQKPLEYSGSLDKFEYEEMTPVIGRLYPSVQIRDLLTAENSKQILQDLALTISQRGVVFFRNQNITLAEQKQFVRLISQLSGCPASSDLHVHPLVKSPDYETVDDEAFDEYVYVVSNRAQLKMYKDSMVNRHLVDASNGWHTDATFETVPPDYTCLNMKSTPPSGGDTLWCSSTALYEKISPPYRAFLESLTATFAQSSLAKSAERGGFEMMSPRGSPLNAGTELSTTHPVVRTNPVTGSKAIWAVGVHCQKINDVYPHEDKQIRDYFLHLITHSHDIQVRYKWGVNDLAIWDNRSVYHAATPDIGQGIRFGNRVTSVGEKPYL